MLKKKTGKQKLYEEASQVASDALVSIRTIASFCAEDKVMKLYDKKCEVYATSFYIGARFVVTGNTTFPKVFQEFLGLSMAAISVSQSGSFVSDSGKAKAAAASVFALLDQKSK
ncbi:NHPM bacteriocin system ABC transporter, peptidase/ATP-binding protein [Artemisia annua]|uniref:NHPM bacteriocin system ABC transporter, peptidase/ATP-binding protein n=1 Tax=Artemisia annua TaxID=35608 RepID=A0A2U1KRA1_ARTAN|nr:NHPM bacteriocin system ABC transporter, peptidase/ATP-binding protein [Artemisia annua]